MKLIVKLLALSVFLLPLILAGALMLAVEDKPRLHDRADLTPERIASGKQVFEKNDPSRMKSGSIVKAGLDQQELDLALNYFANHYAGSVAGLSIDKGRAVIESTLPLPANPLGRFVNLKVELKQTDTIPRIDAITLGKLSIPPALAEIVVSYGLTAGQPLGNWRAVTDMIKNVEFERKRMTVTYRWRDDLPAQLSGAVFSGQDHKRVEAYQRRLAELTQGGTSRLNLTALTKPLFQLARDRGNSGQAVAENRAVILVLTFYANHQDFKKLIPESKTWTAPVWRTVTLHDRADFPKHYLISAMLAAYSGTPLSNAVGLFKEVEDSRGGSGFSFNDIAADRAGVRLGELATGNESKAGKLQALMATANESDIMPVTADLPEFMPEAEFNRRFGGLKGEPYRHMMEKIEQRIAALPINRD
jgi:hypothetical protein